MRFRRKKRVPTILDAHLFQLAELDEDLRRLKAQAVGLRDRLRQAEHMISYHSEEKAKAVGSGRNERSINYHDAHISDLQNKALGLASRIAEVEQAIDRKRQDRLELVTKINELQGKPESEERLQPTDSS